MISAAVLVLNGEPPQYVTGSLDMDAGGTALVFGAATVVTVDVSSPREDEAPFSVTARSRGGLLSLEATASVEVGRFEVDGGALQPLPN